MINYNKEVEREGVYKEYFDKFGEEPETYGLYWDDLETFEKLLHQSINSGKKYKEDKPEINSVY
jgi:hypothetical protein